MTYLSGWSLTWLRRWLLACLPFVIWAVYLAAARGPNRLEHFSFASLNVLLETHERKVGRWFSTDTDQVTELQAWDVDSGKSLALHTFPEDANVEWMPDRNTLLVRTKNTFHLYDALSGSSEQITGLPQDHFFRLIGGDLIHASKWNHEEQTQEEFLWDFSSQTKLPVPTGGEGMRATRMSDDRVLLFAAINTTPMAQRPIYIQRVYELYENAWKQLTEFPGIRRNSVHSHEPKFLYQQSGSLILHDLETGEEQSLSTARIIDPRFSAEGKVVVGNLGQRGEEACVWSITTGSEMLRLRIPFSFFPDYQSAKVSPDLRWVATGGSLGPICIWDLTTGKIVHPLPDDRWGKATGWMLGLAWIAAWLVSGRKLSRPSPTGDILLVHALVLLVCHLRFEALSWGGLPPAWAWLWLTLQWSLVAALGAFLSALVVLGPGRWYWRLTCLVAIAYGLCLVVTQLSWNAVGEELYWGGAVIALLMGTGLWLLRRYQRGIQNWTPPPTRPGRAQWSLRQLFLLTAVVGGLFGILRLVEPPSYWGETAFACALSAGLTLLLFLVALVSWRSAFVWLRFLAVLFLVSFAVGVMGVVAYVQRGPVSHPEFWIVSFAFFGAAALDLFLCLTILRWDGYDLIKLDNTAASAA